MEQIRFYLDEHIPNAIAQGLRVADAGPSRSIGALISSIMLLYDVLTPNDMKDHVEYL